MNMTRRHQLITSRHRAVASVLAMIFLVVFGSLAVAMAIVAQGNLRTADSARRVSRAMSAAETGMVFAANRLEVEARRFVTVEGTIDADYAEDLWFGDFSSDDVTVLEPTDYETDRALDETGLMHAVADAHDASPHDVLVEVGDDDLPAIDTELGRVFVQPIALTSHDDDGPYFRLRYELLDGVPAVRVTSTGYDGDVTRTLQMDFQLTKKIEYAIMSPSRIMIGKNVRVDGPLGSLYGVFDNTNDADPSQLSPGNGDPLVMRSDFYYLADSLNDNLDILHEQLAEYDEDGDNRLRPDHPAESLGLSGFGALTDYDGDGYVDDFDLFMDHFDTTSPSSKQVVYDSELTAEVGYGSMTVEFEDVDTQLARLIDEAVPDRDGDGDSDTRDRQLGYMDGIIDGRDTYAKVHGRLVFTVIESDWTDYNGDTYKELVQGPMRPDLEDSAAQFETSSNELLQITTAMFVTDGEDTWYDTNADGAAFSAQVTGQGTYTAPSEDTWEEVPLGSLNAYDYYQRPIYEDMTFNNVRIPQGTNALFVNCIFVGVTYIESDPDCWHYDWNYAGALTWDDVNDDDTIQNDEMIEKFPGIPFEEDIDDGLIIADTRTVSNNIRFHDCTFLGSISGEVPASNPDPDVSSGTYTHWRNKLQFTGNTRFYIDAKDEDLLEQDDVDELTEALETLSDDDIEELEKSSIMLPGWSIDVGNFNNEVGADPDDTPKVKLKGTIIVGILDIRGTADLHGTLLNTFRPVEGQGPLYYGGTPDAFNATIGYFGAADGDGEGTDPTAPGFNGFGEITLRYNPDAKLPDGIPWPIKIEAMTGTYVEGAPF